MGAKARIIASSQPTYKADIVRSYTKEWLSIRKEPREIILVIRLWIAFTFLDYREKHEFSIQRTSSVDEKPR